MVSESDSPAKRKIIEVKDLVKRYKKADKNAVDDVSFYVEEGAFFALLGPNGAGKTTIISILTTTLTKTSGEATILGYDLERQASLVREKIGVIFQKPSLDQNLTSEENIRFHANLYGLYPYRPAYSLMPESYKARVRMLSKVLGIEADMQKPVKNLSGGMKRKLEIIRSLMHSPRVLFLDEPTTGLDPVSRKNLWDYLQDVRAREHTTIFLTTHYIEEAESADYACIINRGKIIVKGSPADIKSSLAVKSISMDSADRARLQEELKERKLEFTGSGPFRVMYGNESAQSIIRSMQTPLTALAINNPSLEDAYIKIIEEE